MSKYSKTFIEEIVRKKLSGRPVIEISKETGISNVTIYQWIRKYNKGTLNTNNGFPGNFSFNEKFRLLNESLTIPGDKKGRWLRENGVHQDHLNKWKNFLI